MEWLLLRNYSTMGTNGEIFNGEQFVCFSIELPWRHNAPMKSCIPEGRYRLFYGSNKTFPEHLVLKEVKGRSGILIHPANNAMRELKGCIAPVTTITGHGRGKESKKALKLLISHMKLAFEKKESIYLTILNKEEAT